MSYKHFHLARTVFYALALSFFISQAAIAANPLFTVDDVKVDVTADNAIKARDQAFAKAQEQAFTILAQRMLPDLEIEFFTLPELSVISSLVQDYEITQEKLSAIRYMATYRFRFKDEAVRRYFSKSGVEFTDIASKPMLIMPFYQQGAKMVLWSPYNSWMQSWGRAETLGTLVPIVVPIGDLADIRSIGDDDALSYDEDRLFAMLARYGAGEAVLAIAVPDEELFSVPSADAPAAGALHVNIYRTDRAGPEHVQQITVRARANQTKAQLFDVAVLKVQKILQKDWKKKTSVASGQAGRLQVRISFNSLEEWANTQRALELVYGVNEIALVSLSPKMARVDLVFQGDERRLRLALEQANLILSTPQIDFSTLGQKYSRQDTSPSPLVYNLQLSRYVPGDKNRF